MAGLALTLHKSLGEAGLALMEAANELDGGMKQRVYDRGMRIMEINKEIEDHINDLLTMVSKVTKP